jgi:acyl carrier protein
MNINQNKKIIFKILKDINPKIINLVENKKINLINDGFIDSFDIIKIIIEINKYRKKEINPEKITKKNFSNINNILKLFDR